MLFTIKIDVDTERGTRIGVPNLVALLRELQIPATFLFSLGPDNTGRAIKRVFRPGFLQKVSRTSVVSTYGIRTLLNGVLLPAPHIGKRHAALLQQVAAAGFEVGIHAYDHQKWQDGVMKMSAAEIAAEFTKACAEFQRIFNYSARVAGAPGWQTNARALAAYDSAGLACASDCRGAYPFFPRTADGRVFNVLQIPTTLPTLDELVGRPEFASEEQIYAYYFSLLNEQQPNVMTIHAELEGMKYLAWFRKFLLDLRQYCGSRSCSIEFKTLCDVAMPLFEHRENIPVCSLAQGEVDGRSGLVAVQEYEK